jgi:integrase
MARPQPLTPAFLRHVKPPPVGQKEYPDGDCRGLRLRLSQGGSATWVLGCRDAAGKPRRFTLGSFPKMGLKAARDEARTLRENVKKKGADPIAEARQRRAIAHVVPADAGPVTLADILDAYAKGDGGRKRSWPRARLQIINVFGRKLTRPASEITAPELQLIVDAHPSITSAGAAVRYFKPLARWAAKRNLITSGIADALDQPQGAQRKRERALSRDEIKAILGVLDRFTGCGDALCWLFWTGCRLNEACSMRWCDVDLVTGLWTIPRTKQDSVHTVPLPRQALAFLHERRGADADDLVFVNVIGNKLGHWDRVTKRIHAASSTSSWHRHDIRRTVATLMGDIGVAPHIIEVALGHALRTSADGSPVSRIAEIYNKSRYRAEHADALQRLADELDRIRSGEDNVVRLRA